MGEINLIRTTDPESKLCFKLLEKNKIKFREVNSNSDKRPILLTEDSAFPYKELSRIRSYVNSLKNYSKK